MPREGHDYKIFVLGKCYFISIHVPREGHDCSKGGFTMAQQIISIHVPREGHDMLLLFLVVMVK